MLTNRKSYGLAVSLEEAKIGFRAEYLTWKEPDSRQGGS
jgi:hypothetical protein